MSDDQQISLDDISFTNMLQVEALLRLLVQKGIITKDEFSQEVEKMHEALIQKQHFAGPQQPGYCGYLSSQSQAGTRGDQNSLALYPLA